MSMTAVQFGAGNIGRGFIAQLFHESGYEVCFIDVVPSVLEALATDGAYTIHIVGRNACDVPITDVRGVPGDDLERVAAEIAGCQVACTAVGANVLRHIARPLAQGLARRHATTGEPLNVLVCENLHEAGAVLRGLVADHLPGDQRDAILAKTGFVQAVVSRMVPLQTPPPGEPLGISVEAYKRLPVDRSSIVGALPSITGVEPVSDFTAYEARKLYCHNCGHAVLGYLGHSAGIEFGYEALADADVGTQLRAVLAETGEGLVRTFGFDAVDHQAHVTDLLDRFANTALGDTCFRLARDPVRKLAPADRLVGAARMCEVAGVPCPALLRVIASAYRFRDERDTASIELASRVAADGLAAVMKDVSGIEATEPMGRAVVEAYTALA